MDKQQMVEKTVEILRPFETANLMETMQNLTIKQIFSHPAVLFFICVVFFFGVIKRSKPVLLTLFSLFCVAIIMRFAMPTPGEELSFTSMLPFIGGSIVIGCVIIYFSFIKSE